MSNALFYLLAGITVVLGALYNYPTIVIDIAAGIYFMNLAILAIGGLFYLVRGEQI